MPNVFGIADDIIVVLYDDSGTDHDRMVSAENLQKRNSKTE